MKITYSAMILGAETQILNDGKLICTIPIGAGGLLRIPPGDTRSKPMHFSVTRDHTGKTYTIWFGDPDWVWHDITLEDVRNASKQHPETV